MNGRTVLRRYAQDGSIYYAVVGKDSRNGDNVVVTYYRDRQVKGDSPEAPMAYSTKSAADGYGDFNAPDGGILHNKQPESQEFVFKGLYKKYGDTHIINTFKEADFGTVLHEYGHYFRKTLNSEELAAAEKAFGVENGKWETMHDERFAEAFVKWLSEGKEPTSALEGVFAKLKNFLAELFRQNPKSHEALVFLDERQREFFAAIFANS